MVITVKKKLFDQSEIQSIAKALGNTKDGLTGSQILHLLQQAKIPDIDSSATKWIRLYNAFCNKQTTVNTRTNILEFIRQAMKPANFIGDNAKYEIIRMNLNQALAFSGLEILDTVSWYHVVKFLLWMKLNNELANLSLS